MIDLAKGAVLETGCVYIVPLLESMALPAHLAAATNPKSSTGRLDVFTRVIAEGVAAFDQIPAGYHGGLYAEICPQTFPIVVRKGSRLSQIRFRIGAAEDSDSSLIELHRREKLVSTDQANIDDGIALSVDLVGDKTGLVGYRAKRHTGIVDVDAPGSCAVLDYWEPIRLRQPKRLILDPDQFYILASKEAVHVPPTHAAEMVPFNPLVGEFRVHYAGFFDPGFGHAAAGGSGAKAVLEVRSHKVPFILEDGQIVGRLIYERVTRGAGDPVRQRPQVQLPGPGPQTLQALQIGAGAVEHSSGGLPYSRPGIGLLGQPLGVASDLVQECRAIRENRTQGGILSCGCAADGQEADFGAGRSGVAGGGVGLQSAVPTAPPIASARTSSAASRAARR